MNEDDADDRDVLDLLAGHRPAAPPAELRERVLVSAPIVRVRPPLVPIAAGLTMAGLLYWETARIEARMSASMDLLASAEVSATIEGLPGAEAMSHVYSMRWRRPPSRPALAVDDVDEIL
jgi:hypothetical protein